jgi:hypothetical protein
MLAIVHSAANQMRKLFSESADILQHQRVIPKRFRVFLSVRYIYIYIYILLWHNASSMIRRFAENHHHHHHHGLFGFRIITSIFFLVLAFWFTRRAKIHYASVTKQWWVFSCTCSWNRLWNMKQLVFFMTHSNSAVKVKLSLCLTKHHVMKTHWGVEV